MMNLSGKLFVVALFMLFFSACGNTAAPVPELSLPKGFSAEVYVDNVPNARSMVMGDKGTLFVASKSEGKVYAVTGVGSDKRAVVVVARGLNMPNGVAFRDGNLYVAAVSQVTRYPGIEDSLQSPPEPVMVADDFPTDGHHGWRYIAFGPDGKLYLPIGAYESRWQRSGDCCPGCAQYRGLYLAPAKRRLVVHR
jgi:glucose/arabinose dehydrogenase